MVDVDDLVGGLEIAKRLGLTREAVRSWRMRFPDFPPPVAKVGGRSVWLRSDVEAWAADHPRGYRSRRQ